MKYLVEIAGILLEVGIISNFFHTVSGKRVKFRALHALLTFGYVTVSFALLTSGMEQIGRSLCAIVLVFGLSLAYDMLLCLRAIFCALLVILMILSDRLVKLTLSVMLTVPVTVLAEELALYTLSVLCTRLVLFIPVKLLEFRITYAELHRPMKFLLPMMALPLASFLAIWSVPHLSTPGIDGQLLFNCAVFALISSNIGVFFIFEKYMEEVAERQRLEMVNQQIRYQEQHFRELAEARRLSNQTLHDLKNSLFAISEAMSDRQDDAARMIDALCDRVANGVDLVRTENDALDALLASKYRRMQERGIQLKFHSYMLPKNNLDTLDLCILLGNLLDNAMEACAKLPDPSVGRIALYLSQAGNYLSIRISNTVAVQATLRDGKPQTTKDDKQLHGLGWESIEAITEKYQGFYSIQQEDGLFTVILSLLNDVPEE